MNLRTVRRMMEWTMKVIEMTPAARVLAEVAAKLRAQRDALLSTVSTNMIKHAQQLMNELGGHTNNYIGSAWGTSWSMFPGQPKEGRNLEVLFNNILAEINAAIEKVDERLPGMRMAVSPPLPTTLRELDELFAPAGTRSTSQAMTYGEWTEASLFAPTYKASQAPEAIRRIISAYRYETGDFDRSRREEKQFCDLADILMPQLDCYYEDVLVHDRDVLYGMSVGQEGLVVAKESGFGSWFYPTVGAEQNTPLTQQREHDLHTARAIALVTYDSVTRMEPGNACGYWRKAMQRAEAA